MGWIAFDLCVCVCAYVLCMCVCFSNLMISVCMSCFTCFTRLSSAFARAHTHTDKHQSTKITNTKQLYARPYPDERPQQNLLQTKIHSHTWQYARIKKMWQTIWILNNVSSYKLTEGLPLFPACCDSRKTKKFLRFFATFCLCDVCVVFVCVHILSGMKTSIVDSWDPATFMCALAWVRLYVVSRLCALF